MPTNKTALEMLIEAINSVQESCVRLGMRTDEVAYILELAKHTLPTERTQIEEGVKRGYEEGAFVWDKDTTSCHESYSKCAVNYASDYYTKTFKDGE